MPQGLKDELGTQEPALPGNALNWIGGEILQTNSSIQLKANFPNKAHRLWPGQLVNARLLVDTRHDA
jgi:hypothetical protein